MIQTLLFFRGLLKSQNDWCVTNNVHSVESFCILPKLPLSDHTPCAIALKLKIKISCQTIKEFNDGMYCYGHPDKSRKFRKVMSISNINVAAVIKQFDEITDQMMAVIDDATTDRNSIALNLENAIILNMQ